MSSSWGSQVAAVFGKELKTELRSRHGLFTAGLFGFLTVIVIVFASLADSPSASTSAGLLCSALVFSAVATMPRSMLAEDEQGTFAMLQLLAEPSAAVFGKLLSNSLQLVLTTVFLTVVFLGMTGTEVPRPAVLAAALVLLPLALAGGTTFCSGLVIGASNRWLLAGAVALPMLVPVVFLGVAVVRYALGAGPDGTGVESLVALLGFTVATFAAGPGLVATVWRND